MSALSEQKNKIVAEINSALGSELVIFSDLAYPPSLDVDMGDISLPCYFLSKKLGRDPARIANDLALKLESGDVISGASNLGPYLNISLTEDFYTKVIEEVLAKKADYGQGENKKIERVMIEFSNVNTHKEYHVGHLRNLFYGDAVSRILSANGYDVFPVSYINDFGIHVAKTIWMLGKKAEENGLKLKKMSLGEVYAEACEKLTDNKDANDEVKDIMKAIESRQGKYYELWQETRKWSIEQFAKIYAELGVEFGHIFYESEYIDKGREIVNELLTKNILKKSDGALIADLKSESLSVLVLLRSDGTATYPVADLALAVEKFDRFNIDKSLYVVDVRQTLYFKQLFSILRKLGYQKDTLHLAYDFLKLPDGMISSRTGNVITYDELHQQMMEVIMTETKSRHDDWSQEKLIYSAEKIVSAAIKFEMLKIGATQAITFDIKKSLSFDGYSSAYLQYTYARMQSILRKQEDIAAATQTKLRLLTHKKERGLILKLAKFSEVVALAGESYDPSEIAKYLFDLGQAVNDYYHDVNILKAEDEVRDARLELLSAVCQVMKNGLVMLGIEVLEEM